MYYTYLKFILVMILFSSIFFLFVFDAFFIIKLL